MFQKLNVRHQYHRRQVDASSPAYNPTRPLLRKYPQRELEDAFRSSLVAEQTIHNLNKATERNDFLSQKAGLGTSTDFRRWHPDRFAADVCRSKLNYLPTYVRGIQEANSLAGARQESRLPSLKQLMLIVLALLISASAAMAQTPSFTYQGRLTDGGTPANGNYDLQFALFDNSSGGTQVGSTQTLSTVLVVNGVFTVNLDFGAGSFPGASRFLEISTRASGGGAFTTLAPRQPITSTPYAVRSLNASSADTIPANALPAGNGNYVQNTTTTQASANFNISGNGTAGGTLSGNVVNADAQYNIGGNRVLSNAGNFNLFAGASAGQNNTGNSNSFFGHGAGFRNAMGGGNAFFGNQAGVNNTTGSSNTFVGASAGLNNTTANNNAFFGGQAGYTNSTGTNNAFFGTYAGLNNTTASDNTFVGADAGFSNTTGGDNAFFGLQAGNNNSTGNSNAFFGSTAGFKNTTGNVNAFFGAEAGFNNATGFANAFFGWQAGNNNSTGNFNTFVGTSAGWHNAAGVGNTMIGDGADVGEVNLTNATAIGFSVLAKRSNSVVLGNGTDTFVGFANSIATPALDTALGDNLYIANTSGDGKNSFRLDGFADNLYIVARSGAGSGAGAGIVFRTAPVTAGGAEFDRVTIDKDGFFYINNFGPGGTNLCRNGTQITNCSSSLRYKKDLAPFTRGLDLLNRLRPITFTWKDHPERDLGLGAEDVAKVEPLLTTKNDKGEIEGVKYDKLTVVLINSVKEQQARIEQQQAQLGKQQNEIAALKRLVCRSHRRAQVCK